MPLDPTKPAYIGAPQPRMPKDAKIGAPKGRDIFASHWQDTEMDLSEPDDIVYARAVHQALRNRPGSGPGMRPIFGGMVQGGGMTAALARAFRNGGKKKAGAAKAMSPVQAAIVGDASTSANRQDSLLPAPTTEADYPTLGSPEKVFGLDFVPGNDSNLAKRQLSSPLVGSNLGTYRPGLKDKLGALGRAITKMYR